MEKAIKKAIEGGWKEPECDVRWMDRNMPIYCGHLLPCPQHNKGRYYSQLLDPLFWQCLGKSLGWGTAYSCPTCFGEYNIGLKEWEYKMHCFVQHLIQGRSAEEFFIDEVLDLIDKE